MHHLSGFDATFLDAVTACTHMHGLEVLQLDLPALRGDRLREMVVAKLARPSRRLPALRMRPVEVPQGLGHPVRQTVDPDVDRHVSLDVSEEGSASPEGAIGTFISSSVPRDRPHWAALVVQDDGRRTLTLLMKIHLAVADGKAAEQRLEIAANGARAAEAPIQTQLASEREEV